MIADDTTPRTDRRRLLVATAAVVGCAAGAGAIGLAVGRSDAATTATPSGADIGFLTDMSAHHGQALVMCQRVLGADTGAPVQAAAAEVLQNQAIELGTMRAWLADWERSTAPPELVMGWMAADGVGMPLEMMPGLATDAELDELSRLNGAAKGRRWLELMSVHHAGGVEMAEAAAAMASADKVIRLARTQAAVQTYEIAVYEQLLSTAYAA